MCFRIWKQDYRYVGMQERGVLGLILKKFSGLFFAATLVIAKGAVESAAAL